ncbi:MAG: HepT-like ribonuclease domain-containing protein [Acetobacteraceae bacterium]
MPSDRSRQALHDIRENARLALEFAAGLDVVGFARDRRTVYAVTRCLEIIPEASRRLDTVVRERHPSLPWRAIMGSGNIDRHDYDNVAEEQLWRTVNHSLPDLIAAMNEELGAVPERPAEA